MLCQALGARGAREKHGEEPAAGSAAVYFIPDDSAGLVAAQAALGVAAALGFGASIAGSSLLRKLQN